MESLLEVPVQSVAPHALPFRVLLEEYRRRRFTTLLRRLEMVIAEMPLAERPSPDPAAGTLTIDQKAEEQLKLLLERQETAYRKLETATNAIANGENRDELDGLVDACQKADQPLKKLLHRMDASAVCLSGGGIRSASISLGVLQGLARFSSKAPVVADVDKVERNIGLMPSLDFLSTVSGGGYMGSWMMSWVFRRMDACGNATRLQAMLTSAKNARRLIPDRDKPLDKASKDEIAKLVETLLAYSGPWQELPAPAGTPMVMTDPAAQKHMKTIAALVVTLAEAHDAWSNGGSPKTIAPSPMSSPLPDGTGARDRLASLLVQVQNELEVVLGRIAESAYLEVLAGLAGKMPTTGGDPEPQPVRHLRSYTSYLAPDLGMTLDTFTLGAFVLRNLVVNWLMLVPGLIALIAAVMASGALMLKTRESGVLERSARGTLLRFQSHHASGPILKVAAFLAHVHVVHFVLGIVFVAAAWLAGGAIPSVAEHHKKALKDRKARTYLFLICVLVGAWFMTTAASVDPGQLNLIGSVVLSGMGFGLLSLSTFAIYKGRAETTSVGAARKKWVVGWGLAGATVFMAITTAGVMFLIQKYGFGRLESLHSARGVLKSGTPFAVFAYPLAVAALTFCGTVYCALIGLFEGEDDREWWARCSGFLLATALGWGAVHGIVLYGDYAIVAATSAITGAALGGVTSFLGFSGKTPASKSSVNTGQLSGFGRFLMRHELVLPVLGGLSILLIGLGMVWVEERLRELLPGAAALQNDPLARQLPSSLLLCVLAAIVAFGFNLCININLFSLHGMYRMRLMRAFLGASNVFRQPDLFTDFDRKDTPHEALMPCFAGAPMHLLNATLNLTGTSNTAWRQRKAEGFSFSPVVCGGWRVGYVPTTMYAGSKGLGNKNNGLTLATAMAISGAAANPNMGYQSSPVLSLLMTFFNLRLGCWLPNPARPDPRFGLGAKGEVFFRKSGPTLALWPLMAEALELTDDKYRWVELTDGGHFENLALYEMVLRRAKTIIVVDGGADGTYGFEDLGNALRKIQIDLGIPIEFTMPLGMNKPPDKDSRYCAVATIRYTCIDQGPGFTDGTLVYIKASLTGHEPADILQYARTHESFPHESTGDQFFTESQFESYRHLGSFIVEEIMGDKTEEDGSSKGRGTMREFIDQAKTYSK
jgi:hypothetical protein